MKLNKKGFTLIELLAVVVILLAISVMAISSISAAIERNKASQDQKKIAIIEEYAGVYYEGHKNSLGSSGCISVGLLGLSNEELTNANGELFGGGVRYTNGQNFTYDELSCG